MENKEYKQTMPEVVDSHSDTGDDIAMETEASAEEMGVPLKIEIRGKNKNFTPGSDYRTLTYGVVGLGNLGLKLTMQLANNGLQVLVWTKNFSKEKMDKLTHPNYKQNITIASSPEDVVLQSQCIFSCLSDLNVVKTVFKPLFKHFRYKIYLECATVTPAFSCAVEKLLTMNNGYYMEIQFIPVNRLSENDRILAAGKFNTAKVVMPALMNVFSQKFVYVGDSPSAIVHACNLDTEKLMIFNGVVSGLATCGITAPDEIEMAKKFCQRNNYLSSSLPDVIENIQRAIGQDPDDSHNEPPIEVLKNHLKVGLGIADSLFLPTDVRRKLLNDVEGLYCNQ